MSTVPDTAHATLYSGPVHRASGTTPTHLWNDSCAPDELREAMSIGAVGATSNPVLVLEALKRSPAPWASRIRELATLHPQAGERELAWRLYEETAATGAEVLRPLCNRQDGEIGLLSIQTDPQFARNPSALIAQGEHFASLLPNFQVKIAATSAGLQAIEEVTARGINITATVCFTVAQALAVADAVERGLCRLETTSGSTARLRPVCALMCGRLDDWLRLVAERDGHVVDPGALDWAGVAVFKKAYRIYRERGYRTRLLSAACRSHLHWSEFLGGDVVISLPPAWWRRLNASNLPGTPRMDKPVPRAILDTLRAFHDFRRAYDPEGLVRHEFDDFPPTRRTLRQFLTSMDQITSTVRDVLVPDPDRTGS